jgi:thioredoxin 1
MTDMNANPTKPAAVTAAPHLSDAEFAEAVQNSGQTPVLVDFYADWCGPCKLAAPIIDKLAGEFQGQIVIAKLDTDEFSDVARNNGVMSIPTVIVFKDGKEFDRQIGFPGEEGYRRMVSKAIGDAGMAKAA